jgi:hypothetical protein
LVAAETSIVRDGRHHASARQHVVAFATRVPRKVLAGAEWRVEVLNGQFWLSESSETHEGEESTRSSESVARGWA